jgi:hypothetical protein
MTYITTQKVTHDIHNNPKGYTQHTEHGESLKSRGHFLYLTVHEKQCPSREPPGKYSSWTKTAKTFIFFFVSVMGMSA